METFMHFVWPVAGQVLRYMLIAGSAFIIFYLWGKDRFLVHKIQKRWARDKDFKREILHSLQASLFFGLVIALMIWTPLRSYTQIYSEISSYGSIWFVLSIPVALVLHDTYFYWMHRLMHTRVLYKKVHLVHHQSVNPSPWTSYSFHILETITEAGIIPILVCVLPMHPLALTLFGIAAFTINVYGHLGFEIMPLWVRKTWLFEILNTSVHHNLHHEKFKGNYGLYFRYWDRLMGTENPNYVDAYDRIQGRRMTQPISENC